MRVIVTGSRKLEDYAAMREVFEDLFELTFPVEDVTIVHGGAKGADRIADDLAWDFGFRTVVYAADWDRYGKKAGPIRNQQMLVAGADLVLAFPLADSRGTWDMVRRAEAAGVEVRVFKADATVEVD